MKKDKLNKLPIYPNIDIVNYNSNNIYGEEIETFSTPFHCITLITYIKHDDYYVQFKKEISDFGYINYLEFLSFVDRFKVDVFRVMNMEPRGIGFNGIMYYIKE